MKKDMYSNEWISAEIQSVEINSKAHREKEFMIVLLKTLYENFNIVKSHDKTNLTVFVFSL